MDENIEQFQGQTDILPPNMVKPLIFQCDRQMDRYIIRQIDRQVVSYYLEKYEKA